MSRESGNERIEDIREKTIVIAIEDKEGFIILTF